MGSLKKDDREVLDESVRRKLRSLESAKDGLKRRVKHLENENVRLREKVVGDNDSMKDEIG